MLGVRDRDPGWGGTWRSCRTGVAGGAIAERWRSQSHCHPSYQGVSSEPDIGKAGVNAIGQV